MSMFDNMNILSVSFTATDNDGNEKSFKFKPLPFKYYPDLYELTQSMSNAGIFDKEISEDNFLKVLSKEVIEKLINMEKVMVKNSYPDEEESKIEAFVEGNMFHLIEPLISLMNRQEKSNQRKVEKVQNELSKTN